MPNEVLGRVAEDVNDPNPVAPAISIRDLRFAFADETQVLDGVTCEVAAGSIVGIVGPSGCGKSTLLHLIAGLLEPTGGAIERMEPVAGHHDLAMVFQKDTLLPWLTVEQNVRFFARFTRHELARAARKPPARRSRDEFDDRVSALLRLVHLDDRAGAYPHELSGGMRRRLQFLSVVAPQPLILLLDEPFSAVDEPTRIGIHQDVLAIVRELRMTVLLVTHDLAEAISLCDRVLILGARPAKIEKEHRIDFGADRDMLALRQTPAFLERYGQLWDDLSAQIARSRKPVGR